VGEIGGGLLDQATRRAHRQFDRRPPLAGRRPCCTRSGRCGWWPAPGSSGGPGTVEALPLATGSPERHHGGRRLRRLTVRSQLGRTGGDATAAARARVRNPGRATSLRVLMGALQCHRQRLSRSSRAA